jgi:hypothetical protein
VNLQSNPVFGLPVNNEIWIKVSQVARFSQAAEIIIVYKLTN